MGFINKNCNLYNKKGQLLQNVGRYPTGNAPMKGNYDVMMIGMSIHQRNVKKGIKN